jgi:hypothetical protein
MGSLEDLYLPLNRRCDKLRNPWRLLLILVALVASLQMLEWKAGPLMVRVLGWVMFMTVTLWGLSRIPPAPSN